MFDILDSTTSARELGSISGQPNRLAQEALRALKAFDGVPTMVYVDDHGKVFALPSAYAPDQPIAEIIGTYAGNVPFEDVADDIRASVGPRLAAIGILANWQDATAAA